MAIYRHVQKQWEASLKSGTTSNVQKQKKVSQIVPAQADASAGPASIHSPAKSASRPDKPRVKGGPLGAGRHSSLGLAATIAKQKDWWSSGTID